MVRSRPPKTQPKSIGNQFGLDFCGCDFPTHPPNSQSSPSLTFTARLTSHMKSISNTPPPESIASDASNLSLLNGWIGSLVPWMVGWEFPDETRLSDTQKTRAGKPKSKSKWFDIPLPKTLVRRTEIAKLISWLPSSSQVYLIPRRSIC